MAEWIVRLKGDNSYLQNLSHLFSSPELNIKEENGEFYIRSSGFILLTDAIDVRARTIEILQSLKATMNLLYGNFQSVEDAGVIYVKDNGERQPYFIASGNVIAPMGKAHGTGVFIPPDGIDSSQLHIVKPPQQRDEVVDLTLIATREPKVTKALRLFQFRAHNWDNLYKIYEVIESDVGKSKVVKSGWATETDIDRFTHTANSSLAVGDDARHGHEKYKPPKKPMYLPEAQSLIRSVLMQWLRSKI